jgi:hypothetical protein
VLTFERGGNTTEYRIDFSNNRCHSSLFSVIKNATSVILDKFSRHGGGGVALNLAINEAQETVDTVDSKLNQST